MFVLKNTNSKKCTQVSFSFLSLFRFFFFAIFRPIVIRFGAGYLQFITFIFCFGPQYSTNFYRGCLAESQNLTVVKDLEFLESNEYFSFYISAFGKNRTPRIKVE